MTQLVFWVFAGVAIIAAFMCITRRSPVASALWLVQTLFALAAIYVLLDAQFIAALQILIYAGAIMVLFLFVIMLLNLGASGPSDMAGRPGKVIAGLLGILLIVELIAVAKVLPHSLISLPEGTVEVMNETQGAVGMVAEPLFRGYLVPFEVTSVLLLAAVVGAVVLAKRSV
ncbi:MAG: NADH-quinone oxidoreductase subunit J [Gemmatimonadetes bacterium]|nr:NADH-quinone oxidoreductase subunit J [Gemmatimonadota bacterium]